MTRSSLSRTAVGAALCVVLTTFAFAVPASADTTEPPAAPRVVWTSDIADGASFAFGAVPAAPTCVAESDDPSVDLECTVTGYSTKAGEHTLTATAVASVAVVDPIIGQDIPHSTTVETRTYTVTNTWTATGFSKPVKMTAQNRIKGGSKVPFTFKVYKDGVRQTGKAVVTSFVAQRVACTDPTAVISESSILSTKRGYTLKYSSGAFHQNWKAPKRERAVVDGATVKLDTCYLATVTTEGGASLTASFWIK